MDPIHFPEETTTLAKNQPQYRTLPVAIRLENPLDVNSTKKFTCKYQLNPLEIEQIKATGCIYFSQFGHVFQPILPQSDSPFGVCPITYKVNESGNYDFWVVMNADKPKEQKNEIFIGNVELDKALNVLMETTKLKPDQHAFIPRPELGIDNNGNIIGL